MKIARTSYYLKTKKLPKNCYNFNEEELVTIFVNLVMPGSDVTEEILDVKDEILKSGGQMFIYLIACPEEEAKLLKKIFQQQMTGIFISMKKIMEKSTDQDLIDVGKTVLNELIRKAFSRNLKKVNSCFSKSQKLTNFFLNHFFF